ncbi:MAG: hypothetical protein ACLR17_17615 [Enterobacteriaceae bacterium]
MRTSIRVAVILMCQADNSATGATPPIEPTLSDTEIGVKPWLAA